MANLDFYAVESDIRQLAEFLFANDWRVYKSYSPFGEELTEFSSSDELLLNYHILPVHNAAHTMYLQVWHPSCKGKLYLERINLDPKTCQGHTFRYSIGGWGMMQLYLGGECKEGAIKPSHFGHRSEKGARKWEGITLEYGLVDDWDWTAVEKMGRSVMYHIRKNLSTAKVGARPILENAAKLQGQGYKLLEN